MPPASITQIFAEVQEIMKGVVTPYGGVRNVKIGRRNYQAFGRLRKESSYFDAALVNTSADKLVVQWWSIFKGTWVEELGMSGETFRKDQIILDGVFGFTEDALTTDLTLTDPPVTLQVNSEIVFSEIVDALETALHQAPNFSLNGKLETHEPYSGLSELAITGEGTYHHVVISLDGVERHFQE